ncbi:MAG: preprotein translocase subunit SecG [Gemmatirosa sp.]|nr:preprotein translocase subunit SecG [Gemmatirosa sp.]
MYTFLLVLLILDCLVLVAAVLLQSGKGSGLAANFGGASSTAEALIGSRQAGNLLTKASWWAGGIFIGLSFILQLIGSRSRTPRSILDQAVSAPTQQAAPSSAAPAVPLTPAPTAPATKAPAGATPAPKP